MYLMRRKQASEGGVQKTRGGMGKGQIPQGLLGQNIFWYTVNITGSKWEALSWAMEGSDMQF